MFMSKILMVSLIVNFILIIIIGYLLFDAGVLQGEKKVLEIQNQVNQNTQTIQQIVNFLNQSIQQNQNVQK